MHEALIRAACTADAVFVEVRTAAKRLAEAMERAHADGMDVINMSLGASFETWPTYPTAVVADRLVDAGVVVVVSQGNEGTASHPR